jgi:hypothetical protein
MRSIKILLIGLLLSLPGWGQYGGIGGSSSGSSYSLPSGTYNPADTKYAGGVYGATPWLAAQAVENQMACDLAMGVVGNATANWPQGTFVVDQLQLAPGSANLGSPLSDGGTTLQTRYNNHATVHASASMTMTCSDGQSHTDTHGLSLVSHFTLNGCATGSCSNAPGDTANYIIAGPYNTGLEVSGNGNAEHIFAQNFGGYGIHVDGNDGQGAQDGKFFHLRAIADNEWYYYGRYKGVTESALSPEASATTTGTTSSIALAWTAVPGAAGYVVYRGISSGGESVWYSTATNSFTDTGAAGVTSQAPTNVVTNSLATPGTITPTPSTTGGTLAAATYFYKITAYGADGWHGTIECCGLDGMADWIEVYGNADAPSIWNYHHLADFIGGGGLGHFDHVWAQLGQVGIAQPAGYGAGDIYEHPRVDFANLEGVYIADSNIGFTDGQIDGSCIAPNALTINTGQEGARFAGQCNQFWSVGANTNLNNINFTYNNGFHVSLATADIMQESGTARTHNVRGATYQGVPSEGPQAGTVWDAANSFAVVVTGPTVDMTGLSAINPVDASPVNYQFKGVQTGQDFYIWGGNSNVTLVYDTSWLTTCSKASINLGTISGFLHFRQINTIANSPGRSPIAQVCGG